jgi:hypothetical protein
MNVHGTCCSHLCVLSLSVASHNLHHGADTIIDMVMKRERQILMMTAAKGNGSQQEHAQLQKQYFFNYGPSMQVVQRVHQHVVKRPGTLTGERICCSSN